MRNKITKKTAPKRAHVFAETVVPLPRKGLLTRLAILECALQIAGREGLEGLTIGTLAEHMAMSKSGVIAHFGSREELQIAVLRAYQQHFVEQVLVPALRQARGLPRLQAMMQRWLDHVVDQNKHGCLFVSCAVEYDDRPGALRDLMVEIVLAWQSELQRAIQQAKEERHLRVDTDPAQLVFELYGVVLAAHHERRLLESAESAAHMRKSFSRLMASYQV